MSGVVGSRVPTVAIPGEWVLEAVCATTDPEIFFPEQGTRARDAKTVCKQCPVQTQCLQWALDNGERYGVWGGMSERERMSLKRGKPIRDRKRRGEGLKIKGELTDLLSDEDRDQTKHGYARYRRFGCKCERCIEGRRAYHRLYEQYRGATRLCKHCDGEYTGRGKSMYCSDMCKKLADYKNQKKRNAA